MTINIRDARTDDGPALYSSWQSLRAYNASVDRRIIPAPVSQQEFLAGLELILARKTSATFVAEDEGRIVGFASGGIEANQTDRLPEQHATIGYLYVEPPYRRIGLGRQLFQAIASWAASRDDVSHFEMTVLAGDEAAEAFWRSIGFTPFIQRLWAPLSAVDNE
jgi:GNAT superfamily N-acetyltransferase